MQDKIIEQLWLGRANSYTKNLCIKAQTRSKRYVDFGLMIFLLILVVLRANKTLDFEWNPQKAQF